MLYIRGTNAIKMYRHFTESLVENYFKVCWKSSNLLLTVENNYNEDTVKLFHPEIWYNSVRNTVTTIEDFYLRHNEEGGVGERHIYHDYIAYLNDPDALSDYMYMHLVFIFNESTDKYEACVSSNDEYELEPIHTILTDITCNYMTATECDVESAINFATYNLYNNNFYSIIFDGGQYQLNTKTQGDYYFYTIQNHMACIRKQKMLHFNQSAETEFFSNSHDLKFFYNTRIESLVP